MKLPYGIADFYSLVTSGYRYVDRTARLRTIEEMGRSLLFLRPRRFGKSLWLRTLQAYYDVSLKEEFDALFGGLAIGRQGPTPLANGYFVLVWDFSKINPRGAADEIGRRLKEYVLGTVESFLVAYQDHLAGPVKLEDDLVRTLDHLLTAVRQTPFKLYLMVDEYDNFANEVMTVDEQSYRRLVHADGPFKALFKWVKAAMAGEGLERLFLTGVSPVVMSDVTSGLNICENVYLYEELNDLCGFTEDDVRTLLTELRQAESGSWDVEDAVSTLRTWYNGYRFAAEAKAAVYNPTLVLYFLKQLARTGRYPRQMLDANLAADEAKLRYLGRAAAGQQAVVNLVQTGRPIEVVQLEERFTLSSMLDRPAQDQAFLASYLYYFGMLTLTGETPQMRLRLEPPNLVVKKLYVDEVRRFLLPQGIDRTAADEPVLSLLGHGEIAPLLRFVEEKIFNAFGKADYLWMDEQALKTAFLVLLWDDVNYVVHSEVELRRGHADLCLLRRADRQSPGLWDVLFELKYLKLGQLGKSAREIRALERGELERLPAVEEALDAAEGQLRQYGRALAERYRGGLRLRSFAVVALGFERLVAREVDSSAA